MREGVLTVPPLHAALVECKKAEGAYHQHELQGSGFFSPTWAYDFLQIHPGVSSSTALGAVSKIRRYRSWP